jgi:hypothetical protein
MAHYEPHKYGTVFGVFVPVNAPDRQTQDRRRGAFEEALGRLQTKVSAEANLASGKHVENSVPYATHLDVICWVLEDTGLDGEFVRLGPLSARHS